jgi:osmotically-inducible protein OsmY
VTNEPHKYLEARIRECLAMDDRTNTLDIQVTIAANKVFLIGQVESEDRRDACEDVVRDIAPGDMEIVNELWITKYESPPEIDERV